MSERDAEVSEQLHAYHDGELRGLSRWLFERRIRRSPELRRELVALGRIGELVRESEAGAAEPDLWDRIEQRLPAVDARRREAERERAFAPGPWLRPLGAVAVAAAAVFAVFWGVQGTPAAGGGVVRWMDSGGRPVMVLEQDAETETTIIWMLDGAVEGAVRGGSREVA